MKFLIFGKFSFNHIYFLFYPLSSIIKDILIVLLEKKGISRYFYLMYLQILSRFLAFIPYIINKKLSKRKKDENKDKNNENEVEYIYNGPKNKLNKTLIKSTIKISIFEFLGESSNCIFHFINNKPEALRYTMQIFLIINTMTQYIVSYFVLNYLFYKHHILSFVINVFVVVIFLIFDIIGIYENQIIEYQYYIFIFIRAIKLVLFSLDDSYSKKALNTQFLSPFSLMLFNGVYEIIFLLIFSIPFIFIKTSDTKELIFVDFKEYLKGINLLISFGILFCNFFFQTFLLIVIDRFSPSHLPLGFIIYSFCSNIFNIIMNLKNNKENKWNNYIYFLFYIILFIGAMIHNEIFIINKCGFNANTKLFLNYRLDEEKSISIIEENDENEDEDSENLGEEQQNIILAEDISESN